ncbi:AI-2E family transporter [Natrinema sp. 1APR25-10V2]|uniref:AI-2E family transporter n=1 Tax=Natrinema sp. 1APR25-10V2 TaxID=2951081 RepID=UPI00287702C9|nr:AI-2E family transporter [Natrinema sp. 1APR25-10V2]MDS0475006.1 AI-2E family transporter [Natrinema sp. 1APR25-10V2]
MDARTAVFALLVCVLGVLAGLVVLPLLECVLAACLLAVVLRPAHERLVPHVGSRAAGLALTGFAVVAGVVPLLLVSLVVLRTTTSTVEAFDGERITAYGREVARTELGLGEESVAALEAVVRSELEGAFSSAAELTLGRTVGIASAGIDAAVGVIVFVFLLYYLLVDGPAVLDWLRRVAPLERRVFDELVAEVHTVTRAVLRSHLLVAVVQGVLGGVGLALLNVPYATTLAAILVLVSFLPTIGVWLVWGPVTVAHTASSGLVRGSILLGYGLVVLMVVDNYLRAILVDRGSGLHPAIALLGVIGGIYLFGITGLFVGPVVLACFKAVLTVANELEQTGVADENRDRPQLVRK